METLDYKFNTQDTLKRLRSLYEEQDQSKIYIIMDVPNKYFKEFQKNSKEGLCEYSNPSERIQFWDNVLKERANLLDDCIPCAYLSEMDQGL